MRNQQYLFLLLQALDLLTTLALYFACGGDPAIESNLLPRLALVRFGVWGLATAKAALTLAVLALLRSSREGHPLWCRFLDCANGFMMGVVLGNCQLLLSLPTFR